MPTIEVSGLEDFLKSLLGARSKREPTVGGEAPHENCECSYCKLARYELPIAPTGEDLHDRIVDCLKMIIENGESSAKAYEHGTVDLVVSPMSSEAEAVMLMYRSERLNAAARAVRALCELLPEDRRPPAGLCPKMLSVADARDTLDKARRLTTEKLAQKKAAAESMRAAEEAVASATAE